MPASRRSTPRRGRSSSVLSNDADQPAPVPVPASTSARVTKERVNRPALPKGTNSALPDVDVPVKLQIIEREGKDIIIGRVKLPLPPNSSPDHAFLLKRFDTNALAASSMFKIAFPYASADEERTEMAYLERRFECDAANGGIIPTAAADDGAESTTETPSKRSRGRPRKSAAPVPTAAGTGVRLQGTWIPASDALEVADEYRILKFARGLIEAQAELDGDRQLYLITPTGERLHQASSKRSAAKTNGAANGAEGVSETPRRKRARQSEAAAASSASTTTTTTTSTTTNAAGETTPSVVRTKTTRTVAQDGSEEVRVERTETTVGTVISPEEANAQLEEARAFAISKRAESSSAGAAAAGTSASGSRKRRAVADAPRSGAGAAGEEEEYAADGSMVPSGALVTTVRRGARAVRRRPIASAAGLVGATAAAGAGVLAYASGGDLQAAIQLAQQGLASLGLSGLSGIFQF
ncbi:hypothetical protein OC834_001571 [Tilletia horrida]|uniref:HTH APSES-type domain-containing protein n=1 Tax=Tilletia horrida TaxID=155126 RepID=A0AAN6JN06_9BASI|nr:hypothetical protein OC834_001571 [Tilletia horrida]KAK0537486.1 hypothetical protein OC835_001725 [Tilletia horrida]KAK0539561.1 hypothetical protein OC842_000911 [Tilletia horrida]KAK0555988.1 hypothetical protein OC844_005976 [Tilletia horrida]